MVKIAALEKTAAEQRRDALEQRRELLAREHVDSVSARRTLLLDGDGDNLKALEKADSRVAAVENSLRGIEDGLVAIRSKIKQLDTALASARDAEAREQKAATIEARVPRLQAHIAGIAPPLKEMIADLHASEKPEGKAAGLLLADAWGQVVLEVAKIAAELQADARHLRVTPPPIKQTSAPPVPQLLPQPFRKADLPDAAKFVDWTAGR